MPRPGKAFQKRIIPPKNGDGLSIGAIDDFLCRTNAFMPKAAAASGSAQQENNDEGPGRRR
jgi:hypothetical protein